MVDYNLISLTHGSINLISRVPEAFADMMLLDSKVNYAEGNYGRLLLQEIELGDFNIHYNIYNIQNRFLLQVNRDVPTVLLHVSLKNETKYYLEGFGEINLKEGQFNIAYLPQVKGTILFEQPGDYRIFKIYFSSAILKQYVGVFTYLNDFLSNLSGESPVLLLKEHGWVSAKISYIINQLIQCNYDEPIRNLYYDNLVKELLLLLLLQKQREPVNGHRYMQSLYEARSIIEKNTGHHYTIPEIAREVGLNELKLRNGFNKAFGTGIFQFMLQARMQKAWYLVLETDKPIKEIASLTGYTSKQNFVTAFKKYFNATPGSLRRK